MSKKKCPRCGKKAKASFCPRCGEPMDRPTAAAAAQPPAPEPEGTAYETPVAAEGASAPQPRAGAHSVPPTPPHDRTSEQPAPAKGRKSAVKNVKRAQKGTKRDFRKLQRALSKSGAGDELWEQFGASRKKRSRARDVYRLVGFDYMFADGTCQVEEGLYSQTLSFSDISYQNARLEDQKAFFDMYCQVFETCGSDTALQVNVVNTPLERELVGNRVFFDATDPQCGAYNEEYNRILNQKMLEGVSNLVRGRTVTFSVAADSYEAALPKLARMRSDLSAAFSKLGCTVRQLDGLERARQISSLLRPEKAFTADWGGLLASGLTIKDVVAPTSIDFRPDGDNSRFSMSGKMCQVLVVRALGARLSDTALPDIIDLPIPLDVSLHTQAIDKGKSVELVRRQLLGIDQDIYSEQLKAAQKNIGTALIPQATAYSKAEAEELLDELQYKNQRLFRFSCTIYTYADTAEELAGNVSDIVRAARRNSVEVDMLECRQQEGLNTVLPLGHNHVGYQRYLTTAQTAMFLPFATQELDQEGGGYYGQNRVSSNLILFNRRTLAAPMGFVLGTPGSGKSFAVKREIFNSFNANPDDEFLIIDPQEEYPLMVEAMGGSVLRLAPDSPSHINLFDVYARAGEVTGEDPSLFKSETVLALASEVVGSSTGQLSAEERTLIDRSVRLTYERCRNTGEVPSLPVFYDVLKKQPEADDVGRRLVLSFELYVEGTLSYFSHPTNVDLTRRITSFSFRNLGANMRVFAMLVILDYAYNRMLYNFDRGVTTWLYIDEVQSLFANDAVVAYFDKFWSEGRKFGLIPTGITQTVERIIEHKTAKLLLSNSDFIMLMKQSDRDRIRLADLLSLSEQQQGYIDRTTDPGAGLLVAGGATIPFKDDWPHGQLYDLWNTKPDEIAERKRAEAAA